MKTLVYSIRLSEQLHAALKQKGSDFVRLQLEQCIQQPESDAASKSPRLQAQVQQRHVLEQITGMNRGIIFNVLKNIKNELQKRALLS